MTGRYEVLGTLGAVAVLVLLVFATRNILAARRNGIVQTTSKLLAAASELNAAFTSRLAVPTPAHHNFVDTVGTKAKLDRYDLRAFFLKCVSDYEAYFNTYVTDRLSARDAYTEYSRNYDYIGMTHLGASQSPKLKPATYAKTEQRLFAAVKLADPGTEAKVHCSVRYTSPKGRNSYVRTSEWDFDAVRWAIGEVVRIREARLTAAFLRQQERSRMTASLRADILRRDGSRCRMCGASAADGARLHVDHIIPVSKGGRTEAANLQTLCQDCNLGKSNRF